MSLIRTCFSLVDFKYTLISSSFSQECLDSEVNVDWTCSSRSAFLYRLSTFFFALCGDYHASGRVRLKGYPVSVCKWPWPREEAVLYRRTLLPCACAAPLKSCLTSGTTRWLHTTRSTSCKSTWTRDHLSGQLFSTKRKFELNGNLFYRTILAGIPVFGGTGFSLVGDMKKLVCQSARARTRLA